MFERVGDIQGAVVTFEFEGRPIEAREGDSVAAALLAAGVLDFRQTPVRNRQRGPLCMMGVCFDCLMEIDGMPNRQACQVTVQPDMRVERQRGAAVIGPELNAGFDPALGGGG